MMPPTSPMPKSKALGPRLIVTRSVLKLSKGISVRKKPRVIEAFAKPRTRWPLLCGVVRCAVMS